jgi:hypothetical protein
MVASTNAAEFRRGVANARRMARLGVGAAALSTMVG